MATPVSWSYGPWRTQGTSYHGAQAGEGAGMPATPYESVIPGGGGETGFGRPGAPTGGPYGPMSASDLSTLGMAGKIGTAANLGRTALGVAGVGLPSATGPLGLGLLGIRGFEAKRNALGIDPSIGYVTPSEADFQSIRDTYGAYAEAQARVDAAVNQSSFADMQNATTLENQARLSAETPSYGGGDGGPDTGREGGGEMGGGLSGGGEARGGAHKTQPGNPRWAIYGENEPETGIFVPESMKRPGIQGRERDVVAAMKTLLQSLRGGR